MKIGRRNETRDTAALSEETVEISVEIEVAHSEEVEAEDEAGAVAEVVDSLEASTRTTSTRTIRGTKTISNKEIKRCLVTLKTPSKCSSTKNKNLIRTLCKKKT